MSGLPAAIPSPTQGVWHVGPFPVRAYALCILLGIVVAIWLGDRRLAGARGPRGPGPRHRGLGGAVRHRRRPALPRRHVAGSRTSAPAATRSQALYVWEGGLGIWGAVALGGARRLHRLPPRGRPPAAVRRRAAPGHRARAGASGAGATGSTTSSTAARRPAVGPADPPVGRRRPGTPSRGADGKPVVLGTFQPTFLYESLWDVGIAVVLILARPALRLGHGRLFALYVMLYTVGRGWIEALRIDPANHILGLRLNLWTSLLVGLGALVYLVLSFRLRPGREESVFRDRRRRAGPTRARTTPAPRPPMTRWMAVGPDPRRTAAADGDTERTRTGAADDERAERTPGAETRGRRRAGCRAGERAGPTKARRFRRRRTCRYTAVTPTRAIGVPAGRTLPARDDASAGVGAGRYST